jgi:quinolinate synthase
VHERFTAQDARSYRELHAEIQILAHPECPPDVLAEADYVGSTAGMIHHVAEKRPQRVLLLTECSMSDNVSIQFPQIEFVRPCNLCPHMKQITLPKILHSLRNTSHKVEVDPKIASRARRSVQRMLEVSPAR